MLIIGPTGVGKTTLLRTLDPAMLSSTLFVDIEAGDLAVRIFRSIPCGSTTGRRRATWHAGSAVQTPHFPPTACYPKRILQVCGGEFEHLDKYSIHLRRQHHRSQRLSFPYAEQQPEAFTPRGAKDTPRDVRASRSRNAARGCISFNTHAGDRRVRGILERVVDDFNRRELAPQMEGAKTGRELPGIVDEIITMQWIDFGDGVPVRAFVCTLPNPLELSGEGSRWSA